MKVVKVSEVAGVFAEHAGTEIATITQRTPVKMVKTGNPFWNRVEKESTVGMLVGASYAKAVEKRLDHAGINTEFDVDKRPNKLQAVEGTGGKILKNSKGELLLSYLVNDRVAPKVSYYMDGTQVDKAILEPWLPKDKVSAKQEEAGLSEEEQVKTRTVKLSNIVEINMRGDTFLIVE